MNASQIREKAKVLTGDDIANGVCDESERKKMEAAYERWLWGKENDKRSGRGSVAAYGFGVWR